MPDSSQSSNIQSPLSYGKFLTVQWTLTSVAVVLTTGRFIIRMRNRSRLALDDWAHGFAMTMLIVYMIQYSILFPISNAVELYGIGIGPKPSTSELKRFLHLLIPTEIMFWVVLYSVKITFLLLYREIFGVSLIFLRVWWIVFLYTFLTFWAAFLTVFWTCGSPSKLFDISACLSTHAQDVTNNFAETMVALNIAGDLAIIALPLWMLRKLQMSIKQKFGFAVMFLMAAIVIFFDIARIAIGDGGGAISLASLWDILEPCAAVIISSLIPYRSLLRSNKQEPSSSYRNIEGSGRSDTLGVKSTSKYELRVRSMTSESQMGKSAGVSNSSTTRSVDILHEPEDTRSVV